MFVELHNTLGKNHFKETTGSKDTIPRGGGSRQSTPFSWIKHQKKSLDKALYRSIHLARCNPDYQLKFPSECRDNPSRHVLHKCHPEAEKRIMHDHSVRLHMVTPPIVKRPERLNRSV